MTAVDDAPTKAGRREWLGLAALALPTFVVAVDLFVLLMALPSLAADLGAGANQQLWTVDIYGFVLAGFLVTMGTLGDRIGRRRLLMIGSAAFAVGSLLCAYSTSVEMLILARALLGVAGATLLPSSMALITTMFRDPKQMSTAFGVWAGTFSLGALCGPVIGGLMLNHFWWGSVFLLAVPLMVLLVVVGPRLLPESHHPGAGRPDPTSVVLSLVALLPVIYGIKELARYGWHFPPAASVAVGLAFGVAFVRRQRRLRDPLLDLRLLRDRTIGVSVTGLLFNSMLGGGWLLMMLLYFQLVAGMSTLEAGLALVPGMIVGALGFQVGPKLAARFRPAYVIAVGLLGAAAGMLLMTRFEPGEGVTTLALGFAIMSFCGAPMPGLGTNLVVASAPPEQAGAAGSLAELGNEFGNVLGLALYGTLGAAVYRAALELPAGTPPDVATAAEDSLAGATAATTELDPGAAAAVLEPAQQAFASAVQVIATIGVFVFLGMATLIVTRLRHVPPFGQTEAAAS